MKNYMPLFISQYNIYLHFTSGVSLIAVGGGPGGRDTYLCEAVETIKKVADEFFDFINELSLNSFL